MCLSSIQSSTVVMSVIVGPPFSLQQHLPTSGCVSLPMGWRRRCLTCSACCVCVFNILPYNVRKRSVSVLLLNGRVRTGGREEPSMPCILLIGIYINSVIKVFFLIEVYFFPTRCRLIKKCGAFSILNKNAGRGSREFSGISNAHCFASDMKYSSSKKIKSHNN